MTASYNGWKNRQTMSFRVMKRRFEDGFRIIGGMELPNPDYVGKSYPCLLVNRQGEVMKQGLLAGDSDFWGEANEASKPDYSFIVHELGGHDAIIGMLKEIASRQQG